MPEIDLKPCPFCGATPRMWKWGMMGKHVVVECANYNVDTHRVYMQGDSEQEVAEAWNLRYDAATE